MDLNTQNQLVNDPTVRKMETLSLDMLYKMVMQCLKRYASFFLSNKLQKYQNTLEFQYCVIGFIYVYQVTKKKKGRTGIFFSNNTCSSKSLKVVSATFLLVWFLSQNDSTCQVRKNVFYFT